MNKSEIQLLIKMYRLFLSETEKCENLNELKALIFLRIENYKKQLSENER